MKGGAMARASIVVSALIVASSLIGGLSSGARPATRAAVCRLPQMVVSVGPYVSEATEQHTLALRFRNLGPACLLYGYPRVTLVDAHGIIPFRIRHSDQMIPARQARPVHVSMGAAAFLVLNKNACVAGSSASAELIEIATPSAPGSGKVSFRFPPRMPLPYRVPDACTDLTDPGWTLTVSPFVPTVRAALNR